MKKKILLFVSLFSLMAVFLSAESVKLKTGKFACTATNWKLQFTSFDVFGGNTRGNVSLLEGFNTIALGQYNISGSRLVIEFSFASGSAASLKNQTRMFTIKDSETFQAPDNPDESWFFLSAY